MSQLLSPALRLARVRRRVGEIAAWRVRERTPIAGWSFDAALIGLGEAWPDREGVKLFRARRFEVPAGWTLAEARLGLDVGGESLLRIAYDSGRCLTLGLDVNHTEFALDEPGGAIAIEAVAKGPFGAAIEGPRLRRAELVWIEPQLEVLVRTLTLMADFAAEIDGHELVDELLELAEAAMARLAWPTRTLDVVGRVSRYARGYGGRDPADPSIRAEPLSAEARASVAEAAAWLAGELRALQQRFPPQGAVVYAGHAHLDTAWLWPLEETRRKTLRTFATASDLIERHPQFRYAQSFAEYYRQLEDDDPALLETIKAQVAAGAWEPVGGFWVEPDINMPCGESLVRQALYGQLYFERTFGRRHAVAWLPDTFGFSGALPQILAGAGLSGMYTVKIGWSEVDRHPHTRFWWEGIDGSRVLVQQMNHPEDNYNGLVTPKSLLRLWRNVSDKRAQGEALQPIGHGDGGGGPTAAMIAAQAALADFPLLPRTRFGGVGDYFAEARRRAAERELPVWVGELYLEYHRGVLTSQGRTKRAHRQAERALVGAELLASAAHLLGAPAPASLEPLWRTLMINQFHDILPGSGIGLVYKRTEPELAGVAAAAEAAAKAALDEIAARLATSGEDDPGDAGREDPALLVVNPDASPRPLRLCSDTPIAGGQAAEEGFVLAAEEIAAPLSISILRPTPDASVAVEARALENRFLRVELADDGTIARIFDKRFRREALAGRGNQIWAYRDQPREYDAWDIDEDYRRVGEEALASEIGVVEAGGQRGALKVVRRFASSRIVQSVRLWSNSARIDFFTRFDWHDRRVLIKARFPLNVRADQATYECAFGVCRRPTHRNTSWDAARFEVAAHRFADLSEPGYGVALLNDGRYGHEALGSELSLSLLRSPILPDRMADEGVQSFTYALLPHGGDWLAGGVLAEAEDLNRPLYHRPIAGRPRQVPIVSVEGVRTGLGALKPAQDGDGLILRLYEPAGARGPVAVQPPPGWRVAGETNLLEDGAPSRPELGPFEIRSWRLAPH